MSEIVVRDLSTNRRLKKLTKRELRALAPLRPPRKNKRQRKSARRANRRNRRKFTGGSAPLASATSMIPYVSPPNLPMDDRSIINNTMTKSIRQSDRSILNRYIRCLVNNENFSARFPDSNPRRTALFTSISQVDVPILFDTGAASARFSAAIQPILGDISAPTHYQAAVTNVTSGLATSPWITQDWSAAGAYLNSYNGRDPRVDINAQYVLSGGAQGYSIATALNGTGAGLAQPSTAAGVQNYVGNIPNTASNAVSSVVGNLPVVQTVGGGLTVPAGQWAISMITTGTTTSTAATNIVPAIFGASGMTINDTVTVPAQGGNTVAFSAAAISYVTLSRPVTVLFTIEKTNAATFIGSGDLSALSNTVFITPVIIPASAPPINYGALQMARPVAQTVLATYMGPCLTDGGQISACYVPRGLLESNYFAAAANSQYGQLQYYENVANLDGSYNGPLKNGAYAWWSPYDSSDSVFNEPSTMNADEWPSIVVSGLYNPTTAVSSPSGQDVVRLRIATTFEFISRATLFEQQVCAGSQDLIDHANRWLADQPHAMPNVSHKTWLSSVLNKGGNWVSKNSDTLANGIQDIGYLFA